MKDFILNGQAHGGIAATLLRNNFDIGALRPWISEKDGRAYISPTVNGKQQNIPTANANASLLRLEWTLLDEVVLRAALPRLRAVADVRGRGMQFTIPNGMAKTVLEYQSQSDISPANISMDGLGQSRGDRPVYDLKNLPLPIIHKDFSFPARQIAVARNSSMSLDLSMAELAARKVAEGVEQLLLGVGPNYSYGGGSVYGLTNYPSRLTYALKSPLASSWIPRDTVQDVLNMRYASQSHFHYGPWVLYTSLAWDKYLDDDLNSTSQNSSNITLRERLRQIEGIDDVVTLDYLNGYDMVMLQMTTDVCREVVGMDITTVQWETHGGMELNFKVMCIIVPNLRTDFNGNTGIVHGAVGSTDNSGASQTAQTFKPSGAVYVGAGNS